jgi:hypothetical protein
MPSAPASTIRIRGGASLTSYKKGDVGSCGTGDVGMRRSGMRSTRLKYAHSGVLLLCFAAAAFDQPQACAHSGRRLLVEVADGVLQAQGVNTGAADGAPSVRPYVNAIHDHWHNIYPDPATGLSPFANSLLPDVGVPPNGQLQGYDLTLTLLSAQKWANPPEMPSPGVVPVLQPLDPGETIRIETVNSDVSSDTLGTLLLSVSLPATGVDDILLNYTTNRLPANQIDVLTFRLSAKPADPSRPDLISDSGPIFMLLSPDGAHSIEKLHHASLFLETCLAHSVPEPSPFLLAALSFVAVIRRRHVRMQRLSDRACEVGSPSC